MKAPSTTAIFAYIAAIWLLGIAGGYGLALQTVQTANSLLDAGFVIIDPKGREVQRFDGWDH
jgi:hypothetical protein